MDWLRYSLAFLLAGLVVNAGDVFAPAFGPDDVAFAECRQVRNGVSAPVDGAAVRRTLGLEPAGANAEERKWEAGAAEAGAVTTFEYLLVLKRPVAVGTVAVSPADFADNKGSRNGGEVWYLKAGAKLPAAVTEAGAWEAVEFQPAPPLVRFGVLPAGTQTQAFRYRDVRVAGTSRLTYWQFYQPRLCSLAPLASGFAAAGTDADGPVHGRSWYVEPKGGISAEHPVSYVLAWEQEQSLTGLFLYSSIASYRLFAAAGDLGPNPGIAPAAVWKPLQPELLRDNRHVFPYWACSFRWFSLPALKTRALKVEIRGVEGGGAGVWISGLGAFTELGAGPVPKLAGEPPPAVGIKYEVPLDGEATFVINSADGHRVRNLAAQVERRQGPAEEAWDLKDDQGRYVAPGTYRFSGIVGPPLELYYRMTPYPNVQQFFPERVPWMRAHDSPDGWLSDHSGNWACATAGDRLYFAASMAEAGVSLIECDLDGRKLWGRHDFGAWKGVYQMAADQESLFVDNGEQVFRLDQATRKELNTFWPSQGPHRRGWRSAMAARDGRVYLCYTGEPVFDNAAPGEALDVAQCYPKADGGDLGRSLRLWGSPPGDKVDPNARDPQGNGRLYLEGAPAAARTEEKRPEPRTDAELETKPEAEDLDADQAWKRPNVLLLAFKQPVPLGSVAFPYPEGPGTVRLSVLKPDAPYPPRLERDADWTPFASSGAPGWNCVPAPPQTQTRALRIELCPGKKEVPYWRLDGMRLLNRRFTDVRPQARIRVNSGVVGPAGEWDAQRAQPLAPDQPGVYLMDWPTPQSLCGLAFKEVEGAVTEVDVWQGAATGEVPLNGPACDRKAKDPGWRNVATYRQARRSAEYTHCNKFARYLDGYVDFGETVATRAIRLRFTEPWLDNGAEGDLGIRHDGRSEHGLHFRDSYCMKVNPKACRVLGVAALVPAGDDPPRDPMTYERIEVWDGKTGKLVRELPVRPGWHGLSFSPAGELHVIEKNHEVISRVDLETGALTPVLKDAQPSNFIIGPDGLFYVRPWNDRVPIVVYDAAGKKVREIGKPGGLQPGRWDPERLLNVHRMCVDRRGSLWLVESQDNPRRIVQFRTDGTFVKELLGNTHYGGGGSLDRTNPRRAFHGNVEFELDDQAHTSRIRAWLGADVGEPIMRRIKDRLYLTSAPLTLNDRQGVGRVFLYDEPTAAVRLVAAMGDAGGFAPLRNVGLLAVLNGKLPKDFGFLWCDRNGNGEVDAAEVEFTPKNNVWHNMGVGMFDEQLGCCGNGAYFAVTEFTAAGVPLYRRTPVPGHPHYRLTDGKFLTLHAEPGPGQPLQNFVTTPAGDRLWGYPVMNAGVSGLGIPAWQPGLVSNEFGVIGHEVAPAGELGEFVVVHSNTGQWRLWTADGLLAGQVLLHKMDPRARFLSFPEAKPGQRLDPVTASQEHFHGFFTRSEADNRYYIVAGFTNTSIIEVRGIEKFRRLTADVVVTPAVLERGRAREAQQVRRQIESRSLLLTAQRMKAPPNLDGYRAPHEWTGRPVTMPDHEDVTFSVGFDDQNLYLCWQGKGLGPLENSGDDFHRYFKTGAALDFQLATDPQADPRRTSPVRGDLRLLLAWVHGQPRAALYQSVAPGAPAGERWTTHTEAGGTTAFDRVVLVDGVRVGVKGDRDLAVEAAVPLAAIGLRITDGLRLKMDWGVLTTGDGTQVKQRLYWANRLATGTADEAVEARLEPHLWGYLDFPEAEEPDVEP